MKNETPADPICLASDNKKLIRCIQLNNEYQLKFLLKNEKLYIQCIDPNFPYFLYENGFNIDELIAVHKYFKIFDNIKEVSSFFEKYDEKSFMLEKNDKNIIIIVKCAYKQKPIDINFNLRRFKKMDENEMIMDLYTKMRDIYNENKMIKSTNVNLKNEIQSIKIENENLKKEIQLIKNENKNENKTLNNGNLKNENENLKNDNENIKKEMQFIKNEIENLSYKLENLEDCIENYSKTKEIINFVENGIKTSLNKKIALFKLLYNAKRDGDSSKIFHEKCDGHKNTLTIIKTVKGKIFGGFTRLAWQSEEKGLEDDKGFLFSYNKKEIYYRNKDIKTEIQSQDLYGPMFGSDKDKKFVDLAIKDNCLQNSDSFERSILRAYNTNGQKYALNDEHSFKVLDYKVYELIFK